MKSLLSQKKLRVTAFRLAVLEVFEKQSNAISPELIEKALEPFDRITLYRTLKTFIEKGIIHEVVMSGDIKKYALCPEHCSAEEHRHQHVHFQCTQCEEVFCVETPHFPTIVIPHFQVDQLEINAKGICTNCLK